MKIPCEIYSRVSGYLRPVNQWNRGKQSEFKDRKNLIFIGTRLNPGESSLSLSELNAYSDPATKPDQ